MKHINRAPKAGALIQHVNTCQFGLFLGYSQFGAARVVLADSETGVVQYCLVKPDRIAEANPL